MQDDRDTLLSNADHGGLVRAAARLLGPAEAEDAVQDAYVRALETAPQGVNAAQAWLLTVVRHLAVDRLRRRDWMRHWLASLHEQSAASPSSTALSAESMALLAEEVAHALRLMASHLTPMEGATLLLHEVFDAGHAEIARASGHAEAASRQRLRRALTRLRQSVIDARGTGRRADDIDNDTEPDAAEALVFRQYLDSLRLRDPRSLWAMLRQPPISATGTVAVTAGVPIAARPAPAVPASSGVSGVIQVGGDLGLVLTLDGVTLCVLPLGPRAGDERDDPAYSTISV